jgi:hypothetical protein
MLTRRRDPDRADTRLVHYADGRVGTTSRCAGNLLAAECWQWSCGFYSGSEPEASEVGRRTHKALQHYRSWLGTHSSAVESQ